MESKPLFAHKTDLNMAKDILMLEAVNGVPVAVQTEAVAPAKREPFVRFGWN